MSVLLFPYNLYTVVYFLLYSVFYVMRTIIQYLTGNYFGCTRLYITRCMLCTFVEASGYRFGFVPIDPRLVVVVAYVFVSPYAAGCSKIRFFFHTKLPRGVFTFVQFLSERVPFF